MSHTNNLKPLAALLLAGAALAGCGGGDAEPPPPPVGAPPAGPDTTAPTVAIANNVSAPTATGPVTFTFVFNEDVGVSFDATDITVGGGTAGAFTRVDGTQATLVVTPTPGVPGTITVSVAAGSFTDIAGNANAAAASASKDYVVAPPPPPDLRHGARELRHRVAAGPGLRRRRGQHRRARPVRRQRQCAESPALRRSGLRARHRHAAEQHPAGGRAPDDLGARELAHRRHPDGAQARRPGRQPVQRRPAGQRGGRRGLADADLDRPRGQHELQHASAAAQPGHCRRATRQGVLLRRHPAARHRVGRRE